MPIAIDYAAQLLRITSPDTEVTLQALHDFVEDERGLAMPSGLSQIRPPTESPTGDPIFDVNGKIEDPANPGVYSQINLYIVPPWQIQFWQGSGYTKITGGKLSGGPSDQPMKATGAAGDITILQSPVDGVYTKVETGVSGLTAEESAQLASVPQIETDVSSIEGNVTTIQGDIVTILSNTTASFRKNVAFPGLTFTMVDVSGQPSTGLSVTGTRSLDSGAFGPLANPITEIGSTGVYTVDLAASDLNADVITLHFSASGAVTRALTIVTTG